MKAIKIIFALGAVALAIAVGILIYVVVNLNQLIKSTVESEGPSLTKTVVELNAVDVSLFKGSARLSDLVIGNPQGYSSDYLIKWDTVQVDTDPVSLSKDVMVIENIVIQGVKINAEQKGYSTNLQALLKNLESPSDGAATPSEADASGADILLAVKKLTFADNAINFVTEEYGAYQLELPSFELADIGSASKGLTPEQLGVAILKPLVKQAKRAAEKRLKDAAKEKLDAKLDEKKQELEEKLDKEKDKLKGKLGDKAGDTFKNLLNRD